MRIAISSLIGVIIGAFATFIAMRELSSKVDDRDVVRFQAAEILKGELVAKGEEQRVLFLIRSFIEEGICRDDELQSLYRDPGTKEIVAKRVRSFYRSLGEEAPEHVREWLSSN